MNDIITQAVHIIQLDWVQKAFWTVLLVLATSLVSRVASRALRHLLNQDSNPLPSSSIIVNIARTTIWVVGASIVLDGIFGINANAIITTLGVGGIAISLGFQDTLSNLIGGIQVTFMGIVRPGDNIEVGTETGVVQDVSWRHTTITNARGETVIIPNSIISKTSLVQLPPVNQINIPFAVVGDRPMDDVKSELLVASKAAAEEVSPVTQDPKIFFSEVTEYGFKGKIIMRVEDAAKAGLAVDAVVRAIAPLTR